MRKTFDAELLELGRELTEMAATAQDAIDLVTSSLSKGEEDGAKAAIALTATMDQMEKDIENHCMSLLMRQQPVARDLRAISTALAEISTAVTCSAPPSAAFRAKEPVWVKQSSTRRPLAMRATAWRLYF